jgi:acyl-CoA reductase-like NAD-dependent aldehyde dehydrogenase
MRSVWIGGARVEAPGRPGRTIQNPATLEPIETVPECAAPEVERAMQAARQAAPGWQALGPDGRAELLRHAASGVRARAPEIAALSTRETGQPLLESLDGVERAARLLEDPALHRSASASASTPRPTPHTPTPHTPMLRAVLPAAHYPLIDLCARIAPVLAAGDVAVCRAPPSTPLGSLALVESLEALPAGVIGMVTGADETATALIDHPWVRALSAPSSLEARRPPQLLAVPRDADLELAVAGLVAHRLYDGGQRPAVCPTVLVEQPLVSALLERLHLYLAFLEVGDPSKPATDLGPLSSADGSATLETQVARTLKQGGKLVLGARRFQPWGLTGHFFQPTLFVRAPGGGIDLEEEILGPVLAICPVEDLDVSLNGLLRTRAADLTVLGGELDRVLASLEREAPQRLRILGPGAGAPRSPLDRVAASVRDTDITPPATTGLAPIEVEHVTERAGWWFPYAERPRPG